MGIQGLLQGLKHVTVQGEVRDYAGQSVAVDASSWLHKSVYSIADHYVECIESPSKIADARCVNSSARYMMKRCDELVKYAGIKTVYLVMDGKRCPLKAVTNQERDRRRQENLKAARSFRRQGNRDKMYEKYKACIKVTEQLTVAVMAAVEQRFGAAGRVKIVWSPYEADAQLCKLCMDGLTQAVITEDSDVLVYSVALNFSFPILFKLDPNNGTCSIVTMDWFLSPDNTTGQQAAAVDLTKKASGLEPILTTFTTRQAREQGLGGRLFVQACVLAGCDYSPNLLNGVGLVTAFKQVRSAIHRPSQSRFQHVLKLLPSKARADIDVTVYEELLAKSEAVFYYHPVCETDGTVVFLQNPTDDCSHRPNLDRFDRDWSFLGNVLADGSLVQSTGIRPPTLSKPRSSVKAKPSKASFFVAKRSRPQLPSQPRFNENAAHTNAGSRQVVDIVAKANPYRQSKKPKRVEQHAAVRKPLLQQSPSDLNRKKPNRFAAFALDREETVEKKSSGITKLFENRGDVRFVKRSFPKDGSRSVWHKKPPAAKQPPVAPIDVDLDHFKATRSSPQVQSPGDELPEPESQEAVINLTQSSFDYGNDDDFRDTLDEPKTASKRSPDRLSAPFGNPAFRESNVKQSKYFGGERDMVRRVTEELEAPPEPNRFANTSSTAVAASATFRQQQRPPKVASYEFYDDFLSDKSASEQEDIVESSPESKPTARRAAASKPTTKHQHRPNKVPAATKPLRYRLGGNSSAANKHSPIARGFQRQRDTAVSSQSSVAPGRGPFHGLKRPNRSTKKQNTILSHFPILNKDKDSDSDSGTLGF